MNIGTNIKKFRKKKGMTQSELGEKLNVSQQMIGQYENGKNSPQMSTLKKIANALEVKVADLMGISDYLDEVESDIKRTTSFYDYLGLLGYEIHENEYSDNLVMYAKESDTKIILGSKDIELLDKLENSTRETIISTIQLIIDAKSL